MRKRCIYYVAQCYCGSIQVSYCANFTNTYFRCRNCDKKIKVHNSNLERQVNLFYVGPCTEMARKICAERRMKHV